MDVYPASKCPQLLLCNFTYFIFSISYLQIISIKGHRSHTETKDVIIRKVFGFIYKQAASHCCTILMWFFPLPFFFLVLSTRFEPFRSLLTKFQQVSYFGCCLKLLFVCVFICATTACRVWRIRLGFCK